jgi:membrane protein
VAVGSAWTRGRTPDPEGVRRPQRTLGGLLLAVGRQRTPERVRSGARAVRSAGRTALAPHWVRVLVELVVGTVRVCLRYRVTGLAAEAGFFALLSLPPLLLGLAATGAYIGQQLGVETTVALRQGIRETASPFLTARVVEDTVLSTLTNALNTPRFDLISVGFLLSLWSGSRALNVYVDTISIMYGLGGQRGIVRTRVLSFSLYLLTLALGAVTIPLVLIGPSLLGHVLPAQVGWLLALYWPVVTVFGAALLTTLYHVSTPVRTPWRWDLPGAALALVIWVVASYVLRAVLSASIGGASIYGPLSAPIVVLIWLYLVAIAVLIGAGLNSAVDRLWPTPEREAARAEQRRAAGQPLTPVQDREHPDHTPAPPRDHARDA